DGAPHGADEPAAEDGGGCGPVTAYGLGDPGELALEQRAGGLGGAVGGAHARASGGEDDPGAVGERGPQRLTHGLLAVRDDAHGPDGAAEIGEQPYGEGAGLVRALPPAAPGGDGEDRRGHVVQHSARLRDRHQPALVPRSRLTRPADGSTMASR